MVEHVIYVNGFNCTCAGGYDGTVCETGNLIVVAW